MPLKSFNGKTFVAFVDISGFKNMMKEGTAAKALRDFFSIGYEVLENNQSISGVFISDCGILYHNDASKGIKNKLREILRVVQEINQKMIEQDYLLTSSIAYGDFQYQDKIELSNMTKNALQGNAYLDAYIDNEVTTPKVKAGECRIVVSEDFTSMVEEICREIPVLKKVKKHLYFYWMLKEGQTVEDHDNYIKVVEDEHKNETERLRNEKFNEIKKVLKGND